MITREKLFKWIMAISQTFSRGKIAETSTYANVLFSGIEILDLCLFIFVFSCGRQLGIWVPMCNVQSETLFLMIIATYPLAIPANGTGLYRTQLQVQGFLDPQTIRSRNDLRVHLFQTHHLILQLGIWKSNDLRWFAQGLTAGHAIPWVHNPLTYLALGSQTWLSREYYSRPT